MLGAQTKLADSGQSKNDLWPGILVATTAIELGKEAFALYVANASSYDAVYGSLSSIIVLIIWLYFSARVILYGTEVISVCRESSTGRPAAEPGLLESDVEDASQ